MSAITPAFGAFLFAGLLASQGLLAFWMFIVIVGAAVLWFIVVSAWRWGQQQGRAVRARLVDRGYDVCIECGYWMGGLPENVKNCPECGFTRQVTKSPATKTRTSE